ncbi:MAG: outer membrane protein assembly factor BamE [Rubrivivax sp.]|jgi:outer membrane protein assembly factor BamE (lipoprotein component of BamABCDE complex)|nr:outer membrane protein assembly factor BamE [Rubrivivax sp.]
MILRGRPLRPGFAAAVATLAAAALLTACDPQRIEKLEEGVATEADVRKQFGNPAAVSTRPDGSKVLEYPRQPEGWTNYVIVIGPDGKMSSLRQLLTPASFAKVQPGQDKLAVMDTLGKAAKTAHYALKNEEVWDWRYKDGTVAKVFRVTFDGQGRVVSTATMDDPRDSMSGSR